VWQGWGKGELVVAITFYMGDGDERGQGREGGIANPVTGSALNAASLRLSAQLGMHM